ncbi:phosphatidylinositol-specific phospholipase C domain-containing protein [Pedobacter sp.]|uniref:phosphatidylinositol-specific phospholipase C domain-containing protein n=1 Tax=Pedobacter sp. TaxID=1411316 RepID=UPI002BD693DE|nr:phosphatidylinositol-specific phospholipase C domain-containing protein [Pedobacter sp.]HWW39331.1 phosphatidylinositol-specific phospholipase C domain-containing protein [Pedobacter sp.]
MNWSTMKKQVLGICLFLLSALSGIAQGVFFKAPIQITDPAAGKHSVRIAVQDQKACFAWEEGNSGIQFTCYDLKTKIMQASSLIGQLGSRPVFCHLGKKLYLLWNDQQGNIQYVLLSGGQPAGKPAVLANSQSFQILSAAEVEDRMVICVTNPDKRNVTLLVAHEDPEKGFVLDKNVEVPKLKNIEYCSAVAGASGAVKLFWKEQKRKSLLSASFKLDEKPAGSPSISTISTEVFQVAEIAPLNDSDHQLMLWKRNDKENKWYYGLIRQGALADGHAVLPYFENSVVAPVIDKDDNGNFFIGTAGLNKLFTLGSIVLYNPMHWITDFILPQKGNLTLKDIVIPGSHDAGMSILNGAGGKDMGIINECNTLTQIKNIDGQLQSGIRMFDLRLDLYKGELYTKHAPSNCMEDAVAGGYGEKLSNVLQSVKSFLKDNPKEFVILSFCHFCDRHIPVVQQADSILQGLGKDLLFAEKDRSLKDITLNELSGKVLVTFEDYSFPEKNILLNTLNGKSTSPLNYKRAYAASNDLNKLLVAQESFFTALKDSLHHNDLVRLDWQLTEAGQEAAFICSEFQSPKSNPLIDGAKLLVNSIKKNKSIIELARIGNQVLVEKVNGWISKGIINTTSRPNILYVDVSGNWITDYCLFLNAQPVYNRP